MEAVNSNFTPEQLKGFPIPLLKTQFSSLNSLSDQVINSFNEEQLFQIAYSEQSILTNTDNIDLSRLRSTRAALECYVKDANVVINISSYEKNGRPSSIDEVLDDYTEWCQQNDVKGEYYRTGVDSALRSIKRSVYQKVVSETWKNLEGQSDNNLFVKFLADFKFSQAEGLAIKWWMSDTKRRLRDLATKSSVDATAQVPYPVFYGGQGVGKTFICRELRKPFGELGGPDKVSSMMDEFNQKKYGLMLISDLDDISKVADRDLANLKNFATSDVLTPRKMRSEENHFIKKITTVVCSSNSPIHDVIPDTTGARRFFQIDVPITGYVESIRTTDFLKLWQAVDINWSPSRSEQQVIGDSQRLQRKRDVVEIWWDEKGQEEYYGLGRSASEMFSLFDIWREGAKHFAMSQTTFGNKVKQFLSEHLVKKRVKRGIVYVRPNEKEVYRKKAEEAQEAKAVVVEVAEVKSATVKVAAIIGKVEDGGYTI
jgi:hypothetical protein